MHSEVMSSKCDMNGPPDTDLETTASQQTEPPPGVKLLQIEDNPPVFLPKGLPATGHKVCILMISFNFFTFPFECTTYL